MRYARLRQFAEAKQYYRQAIAMNPSDRQAMGELANLLAQRGDEFGAAELRRRLHR
jgi:Flp pilus assembly protein TadD